MGATSAEEIQRQHEQALIMVQAVDVAPGIDHGEIPLEQKQVPTEEIIALETAIESFGIVCISSRGRVDVTALQNLIREGYNDPLATPPLQKLKASPKACNSSSNNSNDNSNDNFSPTNFWDASNAAANNVHITRPSHDAWGIKKIVLFFCDDFLQDVYELPWWHSNVAMRDAVQPILDCLQVEPSRVVRLLLAALPPGVTIPIHHDSGEWVKHTHRVHVPVLVTNPARVIFTCGPVPTAMERVDCTPGHVFEMNNQAKHAVSN
jgi:hypothetical protein